MALFVLMIQTTFVLMANACLQVVMEYLDLHENVTTVVFVVVMEVVSFVTEQSEDHKCQ
jgi:hypothetical protein